MPTLGLYSTTTTSNVTNFEVIQISDDLDGGINVSDVQEDGIHTLTLAENGAALLSMVPKLLQVRLVHLQST